MPFLVPLFASIGPFLLWPIEFIFPQPFIVEEVFKLLLIFILLKSYGRRLQISLAVASGVLFSFSESILYFANILLVGSLFTFFERLILTTLLHTITMLILLMFSLKDKRLSILGLLITIIIHFFFNIMVSTTS